MKRRLRTLVRSGWSIVRVEPAWWHSEDKYLSSKSQRDKSTVEKVKAITSWCQEKFKQEDFTFSVAADSGCKNPGEIRMVFKNAADATLFRLVWA